METSKRPSLSTWVQQRCHSAASVTQIKDGSSQKKVQRGKSLFLPSWVSFYSEVCKANYFSSKITITNQKPLQPFQI